MKWMMITDDRMCPYSVYIASVIIVKWKIIYHICVIVLKDTKVFWYLRINKINWQLNCMGLKCYDSLGFSVRLRLNYITLFT